MFLGCLKNKPCFTSDSSPNSSVCITGISGSGKTVRMQKIELDCVKRGKTVLILDTNNTHSEEQIFSSFKQEYVSFVNRIDAVRDGLNISFLIPLFDPSGVPESPFAVINSAVNALTSGQNMGPKQIGILRAAILAAIQNRSRFETEVEAITYFLLQHKEGNAVYQRLWTVLNCGVLRSSCKKIEPKKINILDFTALDQITKRMMTEIVPSAIWRMVSLSKTQNFNGMILALDEFQSFSWKPDAVMRSVLREGRKFNLQVIMATQTLSAFPRDVVAILEQAATHLVFRPGANDLYKTAKRLSLHNYQQWLEELKKLRIGESLAVGNLVIDGCEVNRPIRLN